MQDPELVLAAITAGGAQGSAALESLGTLGTWGQPHAGGFGMDQMFAACGLGSEGWEAHGDASRFRKQVDPRIPNATLAIWCACERTCLDPCAWLLS